LENQQTWREENSDLKESLENIEKKIWNIWKKRKLNSEKIRRKEYPALPKDRMETHACLENLAVKTSKDENFLAYNDSDAGMIIFTCNTSNKTDH
jgi:hypothetical protein